jgi:acyl-CoA synthetase (AMP-forming)/AMP-acid ligase II
MNVDSPARWVLAHARRRPAAPAVDGPSVRLSYGALAARLCALAADLRAGGVSPGKRVVIALPHEPLGAVAILAVQAAGGCPVPINREAGEETVDAVLRQTRARHAVVSGDDLGRWAARSEVEHLWVGPAETTVRPRPARAIATTLAADGAPAGPAREPLEPIAPAADGEALILYTSGSTGQPRGVVQTYRNVDANTRSIVAYLALSERDRAMGILPLFYCYGLSVLQTHLLVGGSVFLDPRFAFPRVVVDAIASEACTGLAGVPLTFELLRRDVGDETLRSTLRRGALRYATQAGGAMAPHTADWVRAALAPARLFVMYGQTEATARLAYLPPERAAEKPGSIGIPIPGVELRVLDPDGRELPAGEVGELVARGDNVTPGYLDAPEETAAVFRGGALHTGDLGYRDAEGFLFLVGRAKEMLKVGGHRVSPLEIERVLARHPAVLDVAVAGRPDAIRGELPAAFVVVREGQGVSEVALRAHCRRSLPPHCVPHSVVFVSSLPRSGAGKVLKQELLRRPGVA